MDVWEDIKTHFTNCIKVSLIFFFFLCNFQDGSKNNRKVDNCDDAANQKGMNADPLEVMLMNMGYRLSGAFLMRMKTKGPVKHMLPVQQAET